jgi:hypothetical protein
MIGSYLGSLQALFRPKQRRPSREPKCCHQILKRRYGTYKVFAVCCVVLGLQEFCSPEQIRRQISVIGIGRKEAIASIYDERQGTS